MEEEPTNETEQSALALSLDSGDEEDLCFSVFFKAIRVLGQGSFGRVVLGVEHQSGQNFAIKVISKKRMGEEFIARVKQEARILEQLSHPNVVQFKRVEETKSRVFIAMEFVRGGSLGSLIRKRNLNDSDVSVIMKSIVKGLAYIHSKNIVHRDIKPENILIEDINDLTSVKIADFGLSSAFSLWTTNGLTEQCGTLLYMAPEFFASRTYSKQIDVWSCAVTMYFLITKGAHPFYEPKKDNSESFKQKLLNPIWVYPNDSSFSSLAKNFCEKLSLINSTERYSAVQALQHPYITASVNGNIPLTMNEQLLRFHTAEKLHQKIKILAFIRFLRVKEEKLNQIQQQKSQQPLQESAKEEQANNISTEILPQQDSKQVISESCVLNPSHISIAEASEQIASVSPLINPMCYNTIQNSSVNTTIDHDSSTTDLVQQKELIGRKPPIHFMIKRNRATFDGTITNNSTRTSAIVNSSRTTLIPSNSTNENSLNIIERERSNSLQKSRDQSISVICSKPAAVVVVPSLTVIAPAKGNNSILQNNIPGNSLKIKRNLSARLIQQNEKIVTSTISNETNNQPNPASVQQRRRYSNGMSQNNNNNYTNTLNYAESAVITNHVNAIQREKSLSRHTNSNNVITRQSDNLHKKISQKTSSRNSSRNRDQRIIAEYSSEPYQKNTTVEPNSNIDTKQTRTQQFPGKKFLQEIPKESVQMIRDKVMKRILPKEQQHQHHLRLQTSGDREIQKHLMNIQKKTTSSQQHIRMSKQMVKPTMMTVGDDNDLLMMKILPSQQQQQQQPASGVGRTKSKRQLQKKVFQI